MNTTPKKYSVTIEAFGRIEIRNVTAATPEQALEIAHAAVGYKADVRPVWKKEDLLHDTTTKEIIPESRRV